MATNQQNFRVRNGLTIDGSTSGSSSFANPATGSDLSYVLPGTAGASSTVLTNDGSGNLSWALPGGGGSTFGNVTVGVATDNTISTTTGNLILDSATDLVQVDASLRGTATTANQMIVNSALTANEVGVLNIWATSTGTPAVGFGPSLIATSELADGSEMSVGYLSWAATDMTSGSEDFEIQLAATKNGASPDEKVYIDSEGNVKADGDLQLNYSFSKPNANIYAYSSGGNGQLTWTGTVWDFSNPVNVNGKITFVGPGSGQDVSFIASSTGTTQDYTLPTAFPASNGYVLSSLTDGTMSWVANPDTNTTYTYTASSTTGGANLTLTGSDATTNTIKLTNGTGVTNTYVSPTEVSVAIGQDVATTANPTFAGVTGGNVTVGVLTDQTISTTTGNLLLNAGSANIVSIDNSNTSNPTYITRTTANTTTSARVLTLRHIASATPAAGFGGTLEWQLDTASGNTERAAYINVAATDVTAGSEDFKMEFGLMRNGATYDTKLTIFSNGDIDMDPGGKFAILGATNGYTQLSAPTTGSNLTYTLPGSYPAASGYVLSSTTGGTMSWVAQSGGGGAGETFNPFLLAGM